MSDGPMLPYKKIQLDISLADVVPGDTEVIRYGIDVDGEFEGIRYNTCTVMQDALKTIQSAVPEQYQKDFIALYMRINRDIIPHTDSGVKTVVNTYLQAGGYTTDFNAPKAGATPFKIPNQTDGVSYQFEDVDVLHSFTAQDGDTYILDVTQMHSVHSGADKDRVALALSTHLPFEKVCEIFS